MAFLRWLYNALAIVGASVLVIIGVTIVSQIGAHLFERVVGR